MLLPSLFIDLRQPACRASNDLAAARVARDGLMIALSRFAQSG
jgi:hypothetical protein